VSYQQRPSSRRERRAQQQAASGADYGASQFDLPGPLRLLAHRRVFIIVGLLMAGGIVLSLFSGIGGSTSNTTNEDGVIHQANEAPDVARDASGTPVANATAAAENTPTVKRYTSAPPVVIDTAKQYTATLKTSKGDIQIELYPADAATAVNAFVFLAQDGYYNNTPFLQVSSNADGSKFTAQAGDPTRTGCGTPGFVVPDQPTSRPFVKGAVGFDKGQFFISYGDYPALTGKETIVGQVTSGLDVLNQLTLAKVTNCTSQGTGDSVQSVTITQS
jgi:cyclophilin family peptidyl-prolyl cis-trans isomerase